jgi:hypothetical protein
MLGEKYVFPKIDIFDKLSKVNNPPIGENLPDLVALISDVTRGLEDNGELS